MLTPSGRFEINKRICLSMSDFHKEPGTQRGVSWDPRPLDKTTSHGEQEACHSPSIELHRVNAVGLTPVVFHAYVKGAGGLY